MICLNFMAQIVVKLVRFDQKVQQNEITSLIKQRMIERQLYREFIQQQGELQADTAQGWGYKVNAKEYVPIRVKQKQNIKVSKIQPMKRVVVVPPSKALIKIDQDLLMLENQKKLNKLTEKAKEALEKGANEADIESAAVKMMYQRIQEYNFILDHRHIIQKNSEKARKIMGIKKSKKQCLNQEIAALKQKLGGSSMAQMISINKRIAKLYKQYKHAISPPKQPTEMTASLKSPSSLYKSKNRQSRTIVPSNLSTNRLSPGGRTCIKSFKNSSSLQRSPKRSNKDIEINDFMVLQELKESSQGGNSIVFEDNIATKLDEPRQPQSLILRHGYPSMKRKNTDYAPRKRLYTYQEKTTKQIKRDETNQTIGGNFISKELMKKGDQMDRNAEETEQVLDVWRHRIDSNRQKNRKSHEKFMDISIKNKRSMKKYKPQPQVMQDLNSSKQRLEKAKKILAFNMKEVKKNMDQKEKVLAIIIKKKQSRFKRVAGTQLIKMSDANEQAKIYLGTSDQRRNQPRQNKTVYGTKMYKKSQHIQTDGPQWLNIQTQSEELYWSMIRNEKINLLLKHKKKDDF